MSIDRWVNKQNVVHTHTVEYYSALIKKKILTHAIAQMNLEKIKLSEISHLQRINTVWFY